MEKKLKRKKQKTSQIPEIHKEKSISPLKLNNATVTHRDDEKNKS